MWYTVILREMVISIKLVDEVKKRQMSNKRICTIGLFLLLLLTACQKQQTPDNDTSQAEKEPVIHQLQIPYEEFRKVIGWVSGEDILVHLGNAEEDQLAVYDLHTGEMDVIYSLPAYILSVELSDDADKIALQMIDGTTSKVQVIDLEGTVLQTQEVGASSYVGMDWNPEDDNLLFISYPEFVDYQEKTVLKMWDLATDEVVRLETSFLGTRWYSSNLYLFVDHNEDDTLEEGALYIGDIRTGEELLINSQVSEFYLHEDSFVAMTPSDFNEDELLLSFQYPFMVDKGYMTVPKVTMNERLVFPYLSQGKRNGAIYGVLPKERTTLESEVGEYVLSRLDFENHTARPVMDLPDSAPISVSNNQEYTLYGWQYEYVINLDKQTIQPLLQSGNQSF